MQEISLNFGQRKKGVVKMKIPQGMEQMVFSFAYYRVKDFEGILSFLKELEKNGLFSIVRDILEKNMNGLIEFEREEFQDVMEMLKKK